MKRILLINVLFLLASVSYSQVQKGDFSIGANLGYLNSTGDDDLNSFSYTTTSINLQYYLTNNFSIGVGPSFGRTSILGGSSIQDIKALNVMLDYAFLSSSGKILPYVGAKYTLYNTKDILSIGGIVDEIGFFPPGFFDQFGEFEFKYTRHVVALSTGIKFFITERINIDNNLVVGTVLKQTIKFDDGGLSNDPGVVVTGDTGSPDGPTGDILLQFTVGFGYIIGAR